VRENSGPAFDPVAWGKLDRALREAIDGLQEDSEAQLLVVIGAKGAPEETAHEPPQDPETRRRRSQERQAAFERATSGLVQTLERLGGRDTRMLWLNWTIAARLTVPAIEEVGSREDVERIELAVRRKAVI
jgi:hypothetical protein